MKEFEEILNESEPTVTEEAIVEPAPVAEEVAAEPVAVEPAKAEGPARGPDGKFIPKGETDASLASENGEFEPKATLGERRRRQEAEAERDALLLELRQLRQPRQPNANQPQADGPPDRWEDPEGYDQWLIGQASQAARAEAMQAFQYQRIQTSAEAARQTLPDYDEKIGMFGQMAQANPALLEQLHRAANPAEYAYNTAKTELEMRQYGGIEGLIKARVDEALKAKETPAPTPTQSIPETLAGEQSARTGATLYTPPALSDILAR